MDIFETLAEATRPDTYMIDEDEIDQMIQDGRKAIKENDQRGQEMRELSEQIQKVIEKNRK
jgi:hypothetical protein